MARFQDAYEVLTPGQKVTVFDTNYNAYAVSKVKRVTKAFAELESGDRFQVDGCDQYPMSRGAWGGHRSCKAWKQEDSDYIRQERLRSKIILWCDRSENFKKLTLEQLDILANAINAIDPSYFKPRAEKAVTP